MLFRSQIVLQKGRLFVVPHQRGQRPAGVRCQRHREEEIEMTHVGEDTSGAAGGQRELSGLGSNWKID